MAEAECGSVSGHQMCSAYPFASLEEARQVIERWRDEDTQERPHRALQQQTPAAFLAGWTPVLEAPG